MSVNWWCIVYPEIPHYRTRKSGRCELHQTEYEAEMHKYRSALYAFKRGLSKKKPPTIGRFKASINYSRPDEIPTVITRNERAEIREQYSRDRTAHWRLTRFAESPDTKPHVADAIFEYLEIHAETLQMLAELTEEPFDMRLAFPPHER